MKLGRDSLKVYFDVCCYNRPFDDKLNDRIELETNAILSILYRCRNLGWNIYKSDIVNDEIDQIGHRDKKSKVLMLASLASCYITLDDDIIARARILQGFGFKPYDSLHLASAESAGIDIFFSTDKKLCNKAKAVPLYIKVYNPVEWLLEVTENEDGY